MTVWGHADRPVTLTVRHGRPMIVKRYPGRDPTAVHNALCRLWSTGLGARKAIPEPIACEGDAVVMSFVEGDPVGARGDVGASCEAGEAAARLLAALHCSGVVVDQVRDASAVARSVRRKLDELITRGQLSRPRADALGSALDDAARAIGPETLVVSHGDFSPRNVLMSPNGLVLIDFDRLQMAGAGRDVAYWGSWIWATRRLAGDSPPAVADGDRFMDLYLRHRPDSSAELARTVAFHRAAALVRIAHGWSALRARPDLVGAILDAATSLSRGDRAPTAPLASDP